MKSRQAKKIIKILCGTRTDKISKRWFIRGSRFIYDRKDNLIKRAFKYYGKGVVRGKLKLYSFITRI